MLHIEKNYYSSSTICKKSQVDIFKITPTGRSQKRIIKKNPKRHSVYINLSVISVILKFPGTLKCDK